jgi:hypothetical protein
MSATIIPFPEGGRRGPPSGKVVVISAADAGQIRVGISPEQTDEERGFAQLFVDPAAARAWAAELLDTYPAIFVAIRDTLAPIEGTGT